MSFGSGDPAMSEYDGKHRRTLQTTDHRLCVAFVTVQARSRLTADVRAREPELDKTLSLSYTQP